MDMPKCCIYSPNRRAEINLESNLIITSDICGFSGEPIEFLKLTKNNNRVVVSDVSSEIAIQFCHCRIQKNVLVLDDNFILQIIYRNILIDISVVISVEKEQSRYSDLCTTTKLPFCIPTVCAYPFYASVLGILEAHNCAKEWMISNYLLPWCRKAPEIVPYWVDFKSGEEENVSRWCPLLDMDILSRESIIENYGSVIDAFKYFISQNRYAYISYNAYYIDEFWTKNEKRYPYKHQCLVIGYDEERKNMLIMDFFRGKLKMAEVEYEKFLLAYDTYDQQNNMPRTGLYDVQADVEYIDELGERELGYGHDIKLLSLRDVSTEIDFRLMYGLTEDFLNGTDTQIRHECLDRDKDKMSFGIDFLSDIRKYLQKCISNGWGMNFKPFYIIQSFNRVMKIRAEVLEIDDTAFLEEVNEALSCSTLILNGIIKHSMTRRGDSTGMLERFDRLIALEVDIVEKLHDMITSGKIRRRHQMPVYS